MPMVAWGAWKALGGMNDDAVAWTASDLDARQDLDWFARHFHVTDAILVSWPGCTLDDPRLERLAAALGSASTTDDDGQPCALFRRVVTGSEVYSQLVDWAARLSRHEALDRLRGTFVGPDGRTTCLLAVPSDRAIRNGRETLERFRQIAHQQCGLGPDQLRMAGHLVETAAIDQASLRTLYLLGLPSGALVVLVAWPFLRSLRLALLLFAAASFCQCASLALLHFTDQDMNGMLGVMPILVLVVFVSGAVHLINYYLDGVHRLGSAHASARALGRAWFPCSLAIVTSAIGVGSLAVSTIQPVRSFGGFTSISLLMALMVLLTAMPGALGLIRHNTSALDGVRYGGGRRISLSRGWTLLALAVRRHYRYVAGACLAAMLFSVAGLFFVKGSMGLTDFFPPSSRIAKDHYWLEEHLGPLLPVEVVIQVDRQSPTSVLDRVRLVRHVEGAIRSMSPPASALSPATFLPEVRDPGGARGVIRRRVADRRLRAQLDELGAATNQFVQTDTDQLWRISARMESFNGSTYEELLADLQRTVGAALSQLSSEETRGVTVRYTGMLPLLAQSHPALLDDLYLSFGISLLLIPMVLAFGMRSIRLGVASVLPNVFPVLVVFGAFGWLGHSVDVGTMMTAAVGLGIAVDDTVHFLTWFSRGGIERGLPRWRAILAAYRGCGAAMLRTTIICSAGMALYATSSFAPAARFGWTVCVLMLAALVGDLLFLPALLMGRLGRLLFPCDDRLGRS
jgi:predicted RND superfamily exporter protein